MHQTPRFSFRIRLALLLGLFLAVASPLRAGVLYDTGFETPAFTAGNVLSGQDGFLALYGDVASTIGTAHPQAGNQAVQVSGSALPSLGSGTFLVGSETYKPLDYDTATGLSTIDLSADVRLDGPATPNNDQISANLVLNSGAGDILGELALSSDGHAYAFGSKASDTYQFGTSVDLNTYHNLRMVADFAGKSVTYYLDGTLLGSLGFDSSVTSTVFGGPSLAVIAVDDASFDRTPYTAYFDNLTVSSVPEPSALALLAIGGVTLGRIRLRRARVRQSA